MAFVFQEEENKSEFYKARAEEFRVRADNAVQGQSRDTFLGLAKSYERVAQLAAEREAREAMAGPGSGEAGPGTPQGRRGNARMDAVARRSPLRQIDMSCPRCRRHMRPTLEQLAVAGHVPCPCCGLEVGLEGARYRSLVARLKLSPSGSVPRAKRPHSTPDALKAAGIIDQSSSGAPNDRASFECSRPVQTAAGAPAAHRAAPSGGASTRV